MIDEKSVTSGERNHEIERTFRKMAETDFWKEMETRDNLLVGQL